MVGILCVGAGRVEVGQWPVAGGNGILFVAQREGCCIGVHCCMGTENVVVGGFGYQQNLQLVGRGWVYTLDR
jgi:hypothetical protein